VDQETPAAAVRPSEGELNDAGCAPMTDTPGRELAERVERLTGLPVTAFASIPAAGGYTQALRPIATLADGSTVFVKAAVDADTSRWMQAECAGRRASADPLPTP
jgi:hypothetical protein